MNIKNVCECTREFLKMCMWMNKSKKKPAKSSKIVTSRK